MEDPRWNAYVMQQFTNDELDQQGNPKVAGLRRVARKLLGPILESCSEVVQAPNFVNAEGTRLRPTVVQHTIKILWQKDYEKAFEATFTEAADVQLGNCEEEYLRFPVATCSTRAEARALRKALQLAKVSAEETTLVPVEEAAVNGMATPTQITFLDVLCKRNDINVMKYVNMGKTQYKKIANVPFEVAEKMAKHLSTLQNDPGKVTEEIKGYNQDWRDE